MLHTFLLIRFLFCIPANSSFFSALAACGRELYRQRLFRYQQRGLSQRKRQNEIFSYEISKVENFFFQLITAIITFLVVLIQFRQFYETKNGI